jgi:4-hydroxy-2-oxoheptanedioate aldolase
MKHILATCRKHKVAAGVHCTSAEEANQRIAEGWQFLAIGSELRMMLDGAGNLLRQVQGGQARKELANY